jgi:hypothetical protein
MKVTVIVHMARDQNPILADLFLTAGWVLDPDVSPVLVVDNVDRFPSC